MTSGEIDVARALWTLPGVRTKARRQHGLPLASLAQEILQRRRAAFRRAGNADGLVQPTLARDGGSIAPVSGWNWLKRELDRRSGVTEWRLHDFRRSIVSICAEHGADISVLDTLLNHASSATRPGVIGTYQRALLVAPTRKVMALWERRRGLPAGDIEGGLTGRTLAQFQRWAVRRLYTVVPFAEYDGNARWSHAERNASKLVGDEPSVEPVSY
jgi:integrase